MKAVGNFLEKYYKEFIALAIATVIIYFIAKFKNKKQSLESLDGNGNADGTLYDEFGQITEDQEKGMTYDQITSPPSSDNAIVETSDNTPVEQPEAPLFNYPDEVQDQQNQDNSSAPSAIGSDGGGSGSGSGGGGSDSGQQASQQNPLAQTPPILTNTSVAPTLSGYFNPSKPTLSTLPVGTTNTIKNNLLNALNQIRNNTEVVTPKQSPTLITPLESSNTDAQGNASERKSNTAKVVPLRNNFSHARSHSPKTSRRRK